MLWTFDGIDGTAFVLRAHSLAAAQAQAHVADKRRLGSVAAGMFAAANVRRY